MTPIPQKQTTNRFYPRSFRLMHENKVRDHLERKRWKLRASPSSDFSETTLTSGHKSRSSDFYRRGR